MSVYDHDLALLQHAYHVGELDAGRRAAERLLRQPIPPDMAAYVVSTRGWYTPTLADTVPVEFRRLLVPPAAPHWTLFNPTLLVHDSRLIGLIRSSNYRYDAYGRITALGETIVRTQHIYVEYAADLSISRAVLLAPADYASSECTVKGFEDCRLYFAGDELRVSASVRDTVVKDWDYRIALARLDPKQGALFDVVIPAKTARNHEKNWMPIIGQSRWLYHCCDEGFTKAVEQRGDAWHIFVTGPAPQIATQFRGGTQLVPYRGGYLALVHEVGFHNRLRRYEHRFVWFNHELRIQRVTAPFCFRKQRTIEFASGLADYDGRFVVSFGLEDETAWLALLDYKIIDQMLLPAE